MIINPRTALSGLLVISIAISRQAIAYELATHAGLTQAAYSRSVLFENPEALRGLGINSTDIQPFGSTYYDTSSSGPQEREASSFEGGFMPVRTEEALTLPAWLMRGAIREDDWITIDVNGCHLNAPNPNEDGINRPSNHFYDPIRNIPLTVGGFLGERAPYWALGTNDAFTLPIVPNTARRNHYTIFDAREAMYRALTGKDQKGTGVASTKVERNKYWATTFRALGDVVHLVEDMAQPQHTRNDPHLGCYTAVAGEESTYEKYIEARATGKNLFTVGTKEVTFPPAVLHYIDQENPYPVPRFADYISFFTTRHRISDIVKRQGLADYSNRGFFSAGTNLYKSDYDYPIQNTTAYGTERRDRDWLDQPFGGTVTLFTNTVEDSFTGEIKSGVPLTTYGSWDEFLQKQNTLGLRDYSLNRYNYDAMSDLLIPRAVAYSAGLIDYFFRGRLEVQDARFTDTGIALRVKNAIDKRMYPDWSDETLRAGGKLVVAYQYKQTGSNGVAQDVVGSSPQVAFVDNLRPGQASEGIYNFELSIPPDATDVQYRLVFRGGLGQESDAIAVGAFEPMSGILVQPSYVPADGIAGPRLVYWKNNQWDLSPKSGLAAGNIDWQGWYRSLAGKLMPTKVLSWQGSQARYFPDDEYCQLRNFRCKFISSSNFGSKIYESGEVLAVTPGVVLGAAVAKASDGELWIIVVTLQDNDDVVYRRPYKRSNSSALYDATANPEGWQEIGRFRPWSLDSGGGRETHRADIPWFFDGAGTHAQTMRRWWDLSTGDVIERRTRLELVLTSDLTHAEMADRGNLPGYVSSDRCSGGYDQNGAGKVAQTSTETGDYLIAVDYQDMQPVEGLVHVDSTSTDESNVTVTFIQPDPTKPAKKIVNGTTTVRQTYSEVFRLGGRTINVLQDDETVDIGWGSNEVDGSSYFSRGSNTQYAEFEIAYYLDLRHDNLSYYEQGWDEQSSLARTNGTYTTQTGSGRFHEGHLILFADKPDLAPYADSMPSYNYDFTPSNSESHEIHCPTSGLGDYVRYGSNFGWTWTRPVGGWAIDSNRRLFVSQEIYRDAGYTRIGSYNALTDGDLSTLIPGPNSNARYYPAGLVR